ncbi:MAG: nitroreductase family protein [Planctomycetota bacterium]
MESMIPLPEYQEYPPAEMASRARDFYHCIRRRRSVRDFSNRAVPPEIIDDCLRAAGSAPSGANMQPWHFVVITNPEIKTKIRAAAEKEENEFYHHRAPKEWLEALSPLGTNEEKPFLEIAPYLIVIFAKRYGSAPDGSVVKHYYVQESVGIAAGMLITALHFAGLATLTHTPSPMRFLNEILGRPANEQPFLLLVTGYPASDARVPNISRKTFDEIVTLV